MHIRIGLPVMFLNDKFILRLHILETTLLPNNYTNKETGGLRQSC